MPLSSAHPRDLLAFARARLVPRDELRRASPTYATHLTYATHVTYPTHPPSLARVLSGASYGGQARPTRLRSRASCPARATAGKPDPPAFARARLVRRELRRASLPYPTHLTYATHATYPTHPPSLARGLSGASYGGQACPT